MGADRKVKPDIMRRTVPWEGAEWTFCMVTNDEFANSTMESKDCGCLYTYKNELWFRRPNDDNAIKYILHEIIHKAFPALDANNNDDEIAIKRAEVVLKTGLEALGVDLSPMLEGYK